MVRQPQRAAGIAGPPTGSASIRVTGNHLTRTRVWLTEHDEVLAAVLLPASFARICFDNNNYQHMARMRCGWAHVIYRLR